MYVYACVHTCVRTYVMCVCIYVSKLKLISKLKRPLKTITVFCTTLYLCWPLTFHPHHTITGSTSSHHHRLHLLTPPQAPHLNKLHCGEVWSISPNSTGHLTERGRGLEVVPQGLAIREPHLGEHRASYNHTSCHMITPTVTRLHLLSHDHRCLAHLLLHDHRCLSHLLSHDHRCLAHLLSHDHRCLSHLMLHDHRCLSHLLSHDHRCLAHLLSHDHRCLAHCYTQYTNVHCLFDPLS